MGVLMSINERKYAVIDIGSNTIRFNIYKMNKKNYKTISTKKTFAGLSSYVENDVMNEFGVNKLIKVLKKYQKIINEFEIEDYFVFATAAVRNAKNSDDILKRVEKETSLKPHLLSGKMEGFCDYYGLLMERDIDGEDAYIVDIGGGSTEIIYIKDGEYIDSISIPEGSLSLYKKNVASIIPTFEESYIIEEQVTRLLKEYPINIEKVDKLYGIGGTIRASGNIAQEFYKKDSNKHVSDEELEKLILGYINNDPNLLKTTLQVVPERIHTQVTGMLILRRVLKLLGIKDIDISKNGVREGYLNIKLKGISYDRL
jgi:exopolyphosphatase/guanosine-5'-triphosphate,3'-diphosphate pyrophosphatase